MEFLSSLRWLTLAAAGLVLGLYSRDAEAEESDPTLPEGAVARLGEDLFRHEECGFRVIWSPDGRTIVTGGSGIRAWSIDEPGKVRDVGPGWLLAVTSDRKCVARLKDDSIVLRDLDSDEWRLLAPSRLQKPGQYDFRWTPDRDLKRALRREDGLTELTDIASGKQIRLIDLAGPEEAARPPYVTAFSPDGGRIAALTYEGAMQVMDAEDGRVLHRLDVGKRCWGVELSPDGRLVAAAQYEARTASIFEVESGRLRFQVPCGDYRRMEFAVSAAWDKIAVARPEQDSIALHRIDDGEWLRDIPAKGGEVSDLAFSPDGRTLAAGCGAFVRFWDVNSGADLFPSSAHRSGICDLSFSSDGESLSSSGMDGSLQLWATTTRTVAATFQAHKRESPATTWAPDGSIVASAGKDGCVRLWSIRALKEAACFSLPGVEFREVAFKPDSTVVAVGGTDGNVRLLDSKAGKEVARRTCRGAGKGVSVIRLAWSPDGISLAVISAGRGPGNSIHHELWDPESGAVEELGSGEPMGGELTFSPDGKTVCERYDGCVIFRDRAGARGPREDRIVIRGAGNGPPHHLTWSPDGKLLAGIIVNSLRVYRVEDGRQVFERELGGIGSSLAWAPKGNLLATGDHMGNILLWDSKEFGK